MIEQLGNSPINTAITAGTQKFVSAFRNKQSDFGAADRYPRAYTSTRGILINKKHLYGDMDLRKGYYFQFNPQTIQDVKSSLYEVRPYAGLNYNDYIWTNGGERIISFQLFMDNTPQSKTTTFRPDVLANSIKVEGVTFGQNGNFETGGKVSSGQGSFEWEGSAPYNTRVHQRGVLPEVELLQSFLSPEALDGESTPLFAEGGVVSPEQFRPPAIVILAIGPIYLEGVLKSAPVSYNLFDADLTPIRATVDIEFAVFEFENLEKKL